MKSCLLNIFYLENTTHLLIYDHNKIIGSSKKFSINRDISTNFLKL